MEKGKLNKERIIAQFHGKVKGPLLVVLGAMHGNEPMGIKAIAILEKMLEVEPITNHDFEFCGHFIGMIGNMTAYKKNERFIDKDINRQWSSSNVDRIKNSNPENLDTEDREMLEIINTLHQAVDLYKPEKLFLLDLHTTSSHGGIFSIPAESKESLALAKQLHAPVVKGMLKGIQGTTLHYFNTENMPVDTVAVTFESGQHEEHKSINRAIAAIINLMRSIGCVKSDDVENIHDQILVEYSKNLPDVTELIHRHPVKDGDEFVMEPGFKNFQSVKKGELLAHDKTGKILCPADARVLMPLYQTKGEDGFFLVKDIL